MREVRSFLSLWDSALLLPMPAPCPLAPSPSCPACTATASAPAHAHSTNHSSRALLRLAQPASTCVRVRLRDGFVFLFPPECKIENCESCFSRNFCTKCKEGLYLHKGRCYVTCPEGYSAANGTMECSSPGKRCSGTFH